MTETPTDRVRELARSVGNGLAVAAAAVGVPFFLAPTFRAAVVASLFLLALAVGLAEYEQED